MPFLEPSPAAPGAPKVKPQFDTRCRDIIHQTPKTYPDIHINCICVYIYDCIHKISRIGTSLLNGDSFSWNSMVISDIPWFIPSLNSDEL